MLRSERLLEVADSAILVFNKEDFIFLFQVSGRVPEMMVGRSVVLSRIVGCWFLLDGLDFSREFRHVGFFLIAGSVFRLWFGRLLVVQIGGVRYGCFLSS